jgi:Uma2 family endonuclease
MIDESDMAIEYQPRKFTVSEYYRMGRTGVLRPDERVELVDGEIVAMPPIGDRHQSEVDHLARRFIVRFEGRASVRIQGPTRLSNRSEPVPDMVLMRYRDSRMVAGHPGPADDLAIVEVSDTTLHYDRGTKLSVYARSGITEVWIVDLRADAIEIYRGPSPSGYADVRSARRGERVAFAAFPNDEFEVDDLVVRAEPGDES